ncbi:MAG: DMT family transporter [Trichloromonadaceae bacterium]
MSIPAAYLGVILIWTTTPLAIKWSAEGAGFFFGLTARMAIGAVVGLALLAALRIPLPQHRAARLTYLCSGGGIFASMLCTYWGSQFLPSGWVSVLFGLNPLLTTAMAAFWLKEERPTPLKLGGMLLGLLGLLVVFGGGLQLGPQAGWGLGAIVLATGIHSLSAIWVKRFDARIPALAVTAGGVSVCLLLLLLTWGLLGLHWPAQISPRAAWSILYLGVVGSVFGFALYFYVLRYLEATRVSLITLVTPVSALLLGHLLNQEPLGPRIWLGTGAILLGLLCCQVRRRPRS